MVNEDSFYWSYIINNILQTMDLSLNEEIKIEIKPTDFMYGGMTSIEDEILFPNGPIEYPPILEEQIGTYFDTHGCVSYSINNGYEQVLDRLLQLGKISVVNADWLKNNGYIVDGRIRFSNRWLVVRSKTTWEKGNSGNSVAWWASHYGIAPLSLCDWDLKERDYKKNNLQAYYDETTINPEADKVALEFAKRFRVMYEWVDKKDIAEAEKRGAVQMYVRAWYKDENGKYYNPTPNEGFNHAVSDGRIDDFTIFDQYSPQIKQLSGMDNVNRFALKINIKEKTMDKPKLEENTLVQLVSGGGEVGLYLDGNIIIDEPSLIQFTWIQRNSKGGIFQNGHVAQLVKEEWDKFPKVNLKMQKL